jgi:hypothetical protein
MKKRHVMAPERSLALSTFFFYVTASFCGKTWLG